jgi:hypothetical protein
MTAPLAWVVRCLNSRTLARSCASTSILWRVHSIARRIRHSPAAPLSPRQYLHYPLAL